MAGGRRGGVVRKVKWMGRLHTRTTAKHHYRVTLCVWKDATPGQWRAKNKMYRSVRRLSPIQKKVYSSNKGRKIVGRVQE